MEGQAGVLGAGGGAETGSWDAWRGGEGSSGCVERWGHVQSVLWKAEPRCQVRSRLGRGRVKCRGVNGHLGGCSQ